MALRKVLVDDLDGTSEEVRPVLTRTFALEDTVYEIDLHDENEEKLRKVLSEFIRVARARTAPSNGKKAPADKAQLDAIRSWARTHGHEVSKFGRIPEEVMRAWEKSAHPSHREKAEKNERSTLFSAP